MIVTRRHRRGYRKFEELPAELGGRRYRVQGWRSVRLDKYAQVEIWIDETMHGHRRIKDRVRFAHWRRVVSPARKAIVRQAALDQRAKLLRGNK